MTGELDQYHEALHQFCRDLSGRIADIVERAELEPDLDMDHTLGMTLEYIRATQANLELCAYECERILRRG